MKSERMWISGRYPGMFPPPCNGDNMTCWIRDSASGDVDLRLDDDANPEFWINVHFENLATLVREVMFERIENVVANLVDDKAKIEQATCYVMDCLFLELQWVGSPEWVKKLLLTSGRIS